MRHTDLSLEPDVDVVAQKAFILSERIRDDDPARVFRETVGLCENHPARAAQVLLAFAAWFDPDVPVNTLWQRVAEITQSRVDSVLGVSA